MDRKEHSEQASLSLLDLPDLVIRRTIEYICFPEDGDGHRDPRDLFHFLTSCRGLYFTYFNGNVDTIFDNYYLELPEYLVYLSKVEPQMAQAAPAAEARTSNWQCSPPGEQLPHFAKNGGRELSSYAHSSNPRRAPHLPYPSFPTALPTATPNHPKPLELMGFRLSILNVIGLEWIAAFAPKSCSNGGGAKSNPRNSFPNRASAIAIMERLDSYVQGILTYTVSRELGRWTMLGWTTSRNFLVLHGIVGSGGREFGCPWVVIGKRHYCNAKITFDMLANGHYTSLIDDGDVNQVWNGYGPPDT